MRQIVDKISAILSLFSFERSDWGVTEISKKLGMPKSTVSELLSSLVEQGFLERSIKARFTLGWRFFGLNQILLESTPMVREARKSIQEIIERTGETCFLCVQDRGDVVIVERSQASFVPNQGVSKIGFRSPLYSSACGRAILAFHHSETIEALFGDTGEDGHQNATMQLLDKLRDEFELIKQRGVAFDRDLSAQGYTTVAAPVKDYHGRVIASVALTAPSARFNVAEPQFVSLISEAGRRVSSGLGHIRTMP